jgi:hypothetical protein
LANYKKMMSNYDKGEETMSLHEDTASTGQHLLLIRGLDWDNGLSADQLQGLMDRFMGWVKSMEDEGVLVGAQPLAATGKVVSGANGRSVADGPFAELKEAVGGYFLLQVDSEERAVALAQGCPALEYGALIEVRPVISECPIMHRRQQEKLAQAV